LPSTSAKYIRCLTGALGERLRSNSSWWSKREMRFWRRRFSLFSSWEVDMRFGFLVFVFAAVYLLVPAIVKADNAC